MSDAAESLVHLMAEMYSQVETATATDKAKAMKKPPIRRSLTLTQRKVAELLRQNTGCHILDSGGAYGRGWQRNQGRAFDPKADSTKLRFHIYGWSDHPSRLEIDFTADIWAWLCDKLTYDPRMQRKFDTFARRSENKEDYWPEVMEKFAASLDAAGIYGDGEPVFEYTYNVENFLSQDIQFLYFTVGDDRHSREEYALVQVHNGADARGGLTSPLAFTLNDELSILEYNRCSISPDYDEVNALQERRNQQPDFWPGEVVDFTRTRIMWDSDDAGCNWRFEGYPIKGERLEDYPFKNIEERGEWEPGTVCVLPDDTALCPITGCKLVGYWM